MTRCLTSSQARNSSREGRRRAGPGERGARGPCYVWSTPRLPSWKRNPAPKQASTPPRASASDTSGRSEASCKARQWLTTGLGRACWQSRRCCWARAGWVAGRVALPLPGAAPRRCALCRPALIPRASALHRGRESRQAAMRGAIPRSPPRWLLSSPRLLGPLPPARHPPGRRHRHRPFGGPRRRAQRGAQRRGGQLPVPPVLPRPGRPRAPGAGACCWRARLRARACKRLRTFARCARPACGRYRARCSEALSAALRPAPRPVRRGRLLQAARKGGARAGSTRAPRAAGRRAPQARGRQRPERAATHLVLTASQAGLPAAGAYDLVVANILRGPLLELAPRMRAYAAPGSRLALSGVLAEQASGGLAALACFGARSACVHASVTCSWLHEARRGSRRRRRLKALMSTAWAPVAVPPYTPPCSDQILSRCRT